MSTNNTYLAVFLGSKIIPQMSTWNALPEEERRARQQDGIAAWKAWAEKHHSAIVDMGGPLGKTKKVTQPGIKDTSNEMTAYMVVRADSHEAAAVGRHLLSHSHYGFLVAIGSFTYKDISAMTGESHSRLIARARGAIDVNCAQELVSRSDSLKQGTRARYAGN